ncbi:uncharacterized protein TNCV_1357511 [Trichonephila clavipes]|uniref:Mutator-like transposase domain-containing protein n=1 Tax=Trichonephila clavipes TaxID=2585209 RepID=A0A8X6VJJ9_TRICX|nr:uncharacterized protein TNCV_1357511 [Trichonephila clavipes]
MNSKSARRYTDYRRNKRRFCGNQHSNDKTLEPVAVDVTSASSKKLCLDSDSYQSNSNERVGLRGIKTFCSVMNLPPPVSQKSYDRILNNIKSASSIVAVALMNKAAKEIAASETNEICVSGDETWKTRGHTSPIGVCSIIGDITGKVIDVEVLSSYCKSCDRWKSLKYGTAYQEWKKSHEPYCVKNHSGSSNKIEGEGMKRIFKRSLLERNAKYVKYIGDGDTKTFPELQNTVSYNLEKI